MPKLQSVALHITSNCSHECAFCYYRDKRSVTALSTDDERFSLDVLKKIIDEIVVYKVERVVLLGGDPAEYSNFLELVKYAHEKGLTVISVSNTHNYNCDFRELAKYLSECESTIHGKREFHDSFCGSIGAYDNALTQLSKLKKLGCSTGITINITPSNAAELYGIVGDIANEYEDILDYINIQRIVPHGRANPKDDFYLKRDNLNAVFQQIERISDDYHIEIQCEDGFPLCLIPEKYWRFINKCGWGYDKLSLNGDGGVSRCGADPRYKLGNILKTSLHEIWQNSPALNEFRQKKFLPSRCLSCPNLNICGGGCVLGAWAGTEYSHDVLLAVEH